MILVGKKGQQWQFLKKLLFYKIPNKDIKKKLILISEAIVF